MSSSSVKDKQTARSCVEHRNCHPNWVTFSNPSVALADCPAPHSSFRLASRGRAYWHRASTARPLNHHPATEAGAAPVARWLHKSGSHTRLLTSRSLPPRSILGNHVLLTIKTPMTGRHCSVSINIVMDARRISSMFSSCVEGTSHVQNDPVSHGPARRAGWATYARGVRTADTRDPNSGCTSDAATSSCRGSRPWRLWPRGT